MNNAKRLVLSFIGGADIKHVVPDEKNISPILRMITHLSNLQPRIDPAETRLVLFNDDKPGETKRSEFVDNLRASLRGRGMADLEIPDPVRISLPAGPTDHNALYEQVWGAMRDLRARQSSEVLFHLSSGTPAMQVTLLLAANCLPLKNARLFETAKEQGNSVNELRLPYILAAREARGDSKAAGQGGLPQKARRQLLEHTVIDDSIVEARYLTLYRAATGAAAPPRVLVLGPTGSGKWHACLQFARWRGGREILVLDPAQFPVIASIPRSATVLVFRLDGWPQDGLSRLLELALQRPDVGIAATFRTDRPAMASREAVLSDGLRGAVHVDLPSLGARDDVVALAKALALRNDQPAGKIELRLKFDLINDIYPRGLHDLNTRVATGSLLSDGAHTERGSYRRASESLAARDVLEEAWQVIAGLRFDPERLPLKYLLEDVEKAVVALMRAEGRTQRAVREVTDISQSEVSRIEGRRYHLEQRSDEAGG